MLELPRNHFGAILADPPWRFKTWDNKVAIPRGHGKGTSASAAVHYNTMGIDDIMSIPVGDLAAEDYCLFMWTCWPLIEDAIAVISAWGLSTKRVPLTG